MGGGDIALLGCVDATGCTTGCIGCVMGDITGFTFTWDVGFSNGLIGAYAGIGVISFTPEPDAADKARGLVGTMGGSDDLRGISGGGFKEEGENGVVVGLIPRGAPTPNVEED